MTKHFLCPDCEKVMEMELVSKPETLSYKGKDITYQAEYYRCTVCQAEIEEPGQLDKNLDAVREEYDRLFGTPSKEDLVALRESYGASQKAFSLLLGFGETTMNNYEKGHTPDSANRLLLQLAHDPVVFRKIYELNKHKIGLLQRKRIETTEAFRLTNRIYSVYSSAVVANIPFEPSTHWSKASVVKQSNEPVPSMWGGVA